MLRGAAVLAAVATGWLCGAPSGLAAPAPVAVFPIPGTKYDLPGTQITFRGVAPSAIGGVRVTGSRTGAHAGRIEADSDNRGASFVPAKPFAAGEAVTVKTQLNVLGGRNGQFMFTIAHSAGLLPYGALPLVPAGSGGVQQFRSRPDLQPASVTVTKDTAPASGGDIFLAPQFGPAQDGPMILDSRGNLVWFRSYPVGRNTLITDFRVQDLGGQPVLTWWQGNTFAGHGRGKGIIFNRDYRQIATVKAGNGLDMGLHEFLITPGGDAYINTSSPVRLPGIGKPVIDSTVQEIDIKTGLVLFEWHSLDHVPLSESFFKKPSSPGLTFDPYHLNSISIDRDGNLIVSMRNTWAVYKINHRSGAVMWTLGSNRSSFKMGTGTRTAFQHDAIVQPDGTLTLFDDGAGPPRVHSQSRGIRIAIDTERRTARLVKQYQHAPGLSAIFEGSAQALAGGDLLLGWGQQPYFSQYTASGQQDFDAHFNVPTSSYRAYRFPWSAQPSSLPALALAPGPNGTTDLYASWNGATGVASWQVLAGASPTALTAVGGARKRGFETRLAVHSAAPYFAVRALGASGQALATSRVASTPAHIAIYGASAFVSNSGFGGLPASCFANHPCHVATTIASGRTIIARTTTEPIAENSAAILYFHLSAQGLSMLHHARGRRLSVQVSARDGSTIGATTRLDLIPFYTSGRGPRRSLTQSPTVRVIGLTDFVSSRRVGGILAGCIAPAPCRVRTTLSVGRDVIARTGPEFLGANELGYLIFSLTPAGGARLAHAAGHQLGAHVTLTSANATASADIALVGFR